METLALLNDVSKVSDPIGGTRNDYNEKNPGKLYREKVPPCIDPVVHASISKAEKRLKKLESDYQHTYENHTKTQSNWERFDIEVRHSKFRSQREAECIKYYKNMRERLQNSLDKLNKAEPTQKGTEKPDHSKKFLMLHGCKSLAQEKMKLQQIGERQHPETKDLSRETIKSKDINWEFHYNQSRIPSKKPIHDLLRRVKETENLREMAIANDKLAGNQTSQDSMTISIKIEIKLLTKVIQKLEKEICDMTRWDDCWNGDSSVCNCMRWNEEEKKYVARYQKKMTNLEKQYESIREKSDEEEKKHIEGLKKIHVGKYVARNQKKMMTHLEKQCKSISEKSDDEKKHIEGLKKMHVGFHTSRQPFIDGRIVQSLLRAYHYPLN